MHRPCIYFLLIWCIWIPLSICSASVEQPAYDLIERVLNYSNSRRDFDLQLQATHKAYFQIQTIQRVNRTVIQIQAGPTRSELTAGIGWYLRHVVRATSLDLWPPLQVVNVDTTSPNWPVPTHTTIMRHRNVPYSYLMNVCTHSYSLVWYSASDWIKFIDWMALSGINLMLALTGQEWIQYKVFRQLGLSDQDIRYWFNGPAFLTWSRGQNEYGSQIAGPLPISWMIDQWNLQRQVILPRLRQLDIIGQLPGFQGNVPIALKSLYQDTNITQQGKTGWMDSLDPLFAKVAKVWMETLIQDFGTDHWYQLDGYFNGGTAPWQDDDTRLSHDNLWYRRGVAAYQGLNATDPDAIWSFQGFAFVGWDTPEQASYLKGFVDAVPSKDKFVIMDMSYDPEQPEWKKWNTSAFFGASFVWNVLHNFGGTDGIKGDMHKVNQIPFDALANPQANIIGIGSTPEGITQNPAYYDFLYEEAFQKEPQANLSSHIVSRAHQRYGLHPKTSFVEEIGRAWSLLVESLYHTDRSVQDITGVAHWKPRASLFAEDRYTPGTIFCQVFQAWQHLLAAARSGVETITKSPAFQYDLVNVGREVLAQLSTPAALNFSDALAGEPVDLDALSTTAKFYQELLLDLDQLVGTEESFLVGRWLASAQEWGRGRGWNQDCQLPAARPSNDNAITHNMSDCELFYDWNARCQVTTWNPTKHNDKQIPGGPIDYAAKHWNGLIRDYFAPRIDLALKSIASESTLHQNRLDKLLAEHAFNWTALGVHQKSYPKTSVGEFVTVSHAMMGKYEPWFSSCPISSKQPVASAR